MSGLRNKVILITGASSGIGYDTTRTLVSRGALIAAMGRNEVNLEKLRSDCLADNPNASIITIAGDVTKENDVKRAVHATIDRFHRLDVLVNNATMVAFGGVLNSDAMEQYDKIMNTNVRAVYYLCFLCVPHLVKTKGNIVNISSVCGIRADPSLTVYSLSKAALDHMTRCMALDLASKQVRVNSVNPGAIDTGSHESCGLTLSQYKEFMSICGRLYPIGRTGKTKDVAEIVCFLADNSVSGFMTGNTIPLDGGLSIACPH